MDAPPPVFADVAANAQVRNLLAEDVGQMAGAVRPGLHDILWGICMEALVEVLR